MASGSAGYRVVGRAPWPIRLAALFWNLSVVSVGGGGEALAIGTDGLDGYEIHEMIGRGGFATVFRATDLAHDRSVAIKVLNGALDEDQRRRFDRERRAIGRLASHPSVIPVFESGYTDEGEAYFSPRVPAGRFAR
jgi:serine/threonine protein kinase